MNDLTNLIWLNTSQGATRAGCHRDTVEKALAAGDLHGAQRVKRGRWRIHVECLDAWCAGEQCAHQSATRRLGVVAS